MVSILSMRSSFKCVFSVHELYLYGEIIAVVEKITKFTVPCANTFHTWNQPLGFLLPSGAKLLSKPSSFPWMSQRTSVSLSIHTRAHALVGGQHRAHVCDKIFNLISQYLFISLLHFYSWKSYSSRYQVTSNFFTRRSFRSETMITMYER